MKTVYIEEQKVALGNIFCIGRNYTEHIKELHNVKPEEPVVFMKPTSSLALEHDNIQLPSYSSDVHHECELVIYMAEDAFDVQENEALDYVGGYAIGLDLSYLSRVYGLQAGDIIYTGTPAGVAAIRSGDELELIWPDKIKATFRVA